VRPSPGGATPAALAERALAALPAGIEAQATATRERSLLLRFAHSRPTQATAVDDLTVEIMAVHDGHTGAAVTNGADEDALTRSGRAAVAAAEASARSGARGSYPGLPAPAAAARPHDGHDAGTARLDPAGGNAALDAAFEAAGVHGADAHGIWTAAEVETAIASTAGWAVVDRVTDAFMKVVAIVPGGRSGYAAQTAVASSALDPTGLAARAAAKAAAPGEQASLEPGEYPVVLERHGVAELLHYLGWLALGGREYAEDRSALCGRLGRRVAAARINLSDSPRYRGTLARAFDAEGVPKAPLPLIEDGVARAVVHDTRSAAMAGAASTGHALAAGGVGVGPAPTNMVMVGGGAADEEALCRPIERGVYVTRLWYVNPVRPKETLLTGVTRDGTFLIEDGEVTRPLADLRFTDGVLPLLGRVEELAARPELTSGGEFYGRRFATGVVCPAMRVGAMRFTA
jgi:predicted Zn-dependent protease